MTNVVRRLPRLLECMLLQPVTFEMPHHNSYDTKWEIRLGAYDCFQESIQKRMGFVHSPVEIVTTD